MILRRKMCCEVQLRILHSIKTSLCSEVSTTKIIFSLILFVQFGYNIISKTLFFTCLFALTRFEWFTHEIIEFLPCKKPFHSDIKLIWVWYEFFVQTFWYLCFVAYIKLLIRFFSAKFKKFCSFIFCLFYEYLVYLAPDEMKKHQFLSHQ